MRLQKGRTTACIAMHFLYIPGPRHQLHVMMIITEHPAYPYLATDVARCRDGDVLRVSLVTPLCS